MSEFAPDARKSLEELNQEWSNCTRCELGQRRFATNGNFVAGEGVQGGIMFIGEYPGPKDEKTGRPFSDKAGIMFRSILQTMAIEHCYLTNVVSCRSCKAHTDASGQPTFWTDRKTGRQVPKYDDGPPSKPQMQACFPRLCEEIYLVDPVVIVALGTLVASFLRGSAVPLSTFAGVPLEVELPGAAWLPDFTKKKNAWLRKAHGEYVLPVVQNQVRYLMVPTYNLTFVHRRIHDHQQGNPFEGLVEDIRTAVRIYDRHGVEAYGQYPGEVPPDVQTHLDDIREDMKEDS